MAYDRWQGCGERRVRIGFNAQTGGRDLCRMGIVDLRRRCAPPFRARELLPVFLSPRTRQRWAAPLSRRQPPRLARSRVDRSAEPISV
jgi:hypothetical protein